MSDDAALAALLADIRACRVCVDRPAGRPLPHQPRPIIRASVSARIAICGQAPGTRVHASGMPFTDPSGDRLRDWMGVTPDEFYDQRRIAIVPMGFCFPGLDGKGSDLPPRKECAPLWRARVFEHLPKLELILLVGVHAQKWHMGGASRNHGDGGRTERDDNRTMHDNNKTMHDTVFNWKLQINRVGGVPLLPLPHPSWRNSGWLKRNPWFAQELLPELRRRVRNLL